ncbi:MAG: hypothetical protein UX26_C0002G0017 [Parcubacteria group bacterium GW2011_GWC1_45_9]|nr:MAG: hypothetical protein UW85_C0004G0009 [Parcubacteria group bacterium GW2011_GWA1_Parcubacteria_45_10]KKT89166.1 MAG: hypothetical protein UW89_C0002G0016 [Parcubacteria group bacterium GW2011_GWB1_45_10]KKU17361.1 MAG: hypothetical protein UX26_C0002G0017 [Parcubacteria group bacterium GW2011_GWC1_45_9]HCI05704.1 hypothetical protein [Patescibacteria group bacterium]
MAQGIFNQPEKDEVAATIAVERLFNCVYGFINQKELVKDIWEEYQKIDQLAEEQRQPAYARNFLALEHFVLNHVPPVVQSSFTRESLRSAILVAVEVKNLPVILRLFFASKIEQEILFFEIISTGLAEIVKNSFGNSRLTELVFQAAKGTKFQELTVGKTGIDFSPLLTQEKIYSIADAELFAFLSSLYQALYKEVEGSFGSKVSLDIAKKSFAFFKLTSDPELILRFFDFVPENILFEERVSFISRQELEKRVSERTKELEDLKNNLEQTVKERTAELEKLKTGLEQTVTERTKTLEEKVEELKLVNRLMVDRELKMVELKKEIEELKKANQVKSNFVEEPAKV